LDVHIFHNNEYNIGDRSVQLNSYGKLDTQFDVYDVRTNGTNQFFPQQDRNLIVNVGGPVIAGVVPKPMWKNGVNVNPIFKHSARFDYFVKDCFWSGKNKTGHEHQIQIVKQNCKKRDMNVIFGTKYARKNDGHIIMFPAMAFEDDSEHFLTCDVDICLKSRYGDHFWRGCYRTCNDLDFAQQDEFVLTTTLETVLGTEATTTNAPLTVSNVPADVEFTTFATTITEAEPINALLSAKAMCESMEFLEGKTDMEIFRLCTYIFARFKDDAE